MDILNKWLASDPLIASYVAATGVSYQFLERFAKFVIIETNKDDWVECSDWLPDENVPVNVAVEFDRPGDWRVKTGYIQDGVWVVWGGSWVPTHWRPVLPPSNNTQLLCAYKQLQNSGQRYPRSCPECDLGPCKHDTDQTATQGVFAEAHKIIESRRVGRQQVVEELIDVITNRSSRGTVVDGTGAVHSCIKVKQSDINKIVKLLRE